MDFSDNEIDSLTGTKEVLRTSNTLYTRVGQSSEDISSTPQRMDPRTASGPPGDSGTTGLLYQIELSI